MTRLLFICLFLALSTVNAFATDWYVDGKNGNDLNPGTQEKPFLNPWRGIQYAQPGDTVHMLPTAVYSEFGIYAKSGAAGAPITLTGDGVSPNLTQVKGDGTTFGIQVNNGSSYINVTNFDVQAPGPWNGIYVGDNSTHVTVSGNSVHNAGTGGIGSTHADYLTISHNTIYGTSFDASSGIYGSGISTYEDNNSDGVTGIKNVINGNTIYSNSNKPCCGNPYDSDGSGIIVDDSRHTQSDNKIYNGTTLIENNIVFDNGGRGIYTFYSDHAVIINNTVYNNNNDPYEASWRPGEIMVESGGDVKMYNNIAYSSGASGTNATGPHVILSVENCTDGAGPIYADYNLLYNVNDEAGLMYYAGTDAGHNNTNLVTFDKYNLWGDPLFISPNDSPLNYQLKAGSPGLSSGLPSMASATDILGIVRAITTGPVDMGAYQQPPTAQCGTASDIASMQTPTLNLCAFGKASNVSTVNGTWGWTCTASNQTTNCQAPIELNGQCGPENGTVSLTTPATGLCNAGTLTGFSGTGPWSWTCAGYNGGSNAPCSALLETNGVCGAASGVASTTAPTSGLCATGAASSVSGSSTGPWKWTCTGAHGGTIASCQAAISMLTITVVAAETPYQGDALMTVTVNGAVVGTSFVTTNYNNNMWQTLTFQTPRPTTLSTIGINLINHIAGSSPGQQRNLYVLGINVNGTTFMSAKALSLPNPVSSTGVEALTSNSGIVWNGALVPGN